MIKLLITIIFIVSSLVGGLYVVYPQYESYQRQLKENDALQEELENVMVYVAELKAIEKKIEENKNYFEKLEKAFPEDHDAPSLFLYLEGLMEENNLAPESNFGDFSVQEYRYGEEEHNRIKETVFGLNLAGSYQDMKSFFRETEGLMRIITINNIRITGEGSPDPFGRADRGGRRGTVINIEGKTYSY